jgi:hypothetical protein
MKKSRKTEHSGAKNGGGHWGTRDEAKSLSKKARRANSAEIIENEKQKLQRYDEDAPTYFSVRKQALKIKGFHSLGLPS